MVSTIYISHKKSYSVCYLEICSTLSTVWPFLVLDNSCISDINNFGCKSEKKTHHFDIPGDFVGCGTLLHLRYINMYLSVCCGCGQWNRCPCPWPLLFWFWQHQKTNTLAGMPLLYVTMVCFMETFCISICSENSSTGIPRFLRFRFPPFLI